MFNPDRHNRSFVHCASPFTVEYAATADPHAQEHDPQHLLAAIHYSELGEQPAGVPACICVRARPLNECNTEFWHSAQPVSQGCERGIVFRHNEQVLVGHLRVPEQECADLETAAYLAYCNLYTFTQESDYTYPLRIWNWFPAINRVDGELERYQSFCRGRHRALASLETMHLPAASAIGTHAGELLIYFLAARTPGAQVENPRQVSAFRYPARYSPKSPSFSRAVVKHWDATPHLYISGTASIVGHETRHTDTLAQLDESLHNLDALIRHADDQHGIGIRSAAQLNRLKCYVRHSQERAVVQECLAEKLDTQSSVLLLEGDICRANLRLEIEGIYTGDK